MILYVIKDTERDRYKLGIARVIKTRLGNLQVGSPSLLEVIMTVTVNDAHAKAVERQLHEAFRDKRIHGEWFVLTHEEVSAIPSLLVEIESRPCTKANPSKKTPVNSMSGPLSLEQAFKIPFKNPELRKRLQLLEGCTEEITTRRWAEIAACSHDTALRDIAALTEVGILKRSVAGGRSISYELQAPSTLQVPSVAS